MIQRRKLFDIEYFQETINFSNAMRILMLTKIFILVLGHMMLIMANLFWQLLVQEALLEFLVPLPWIVSSITSDMVKYVIEDFHFNFSL